jgi:hypothetical protein
LLQATTSVRRLLMTEHDYDNGYRAGMQKVRDLARIDEMEEALFDMVGLFSADNMLLKGTLLPSALYAARAVLQTRRIEATQRSTKRNKPMTKLEELKAAQAALIAALDVLGAARDAYDAEPNKTKEQTNAD